MTWVKVAGPNHIAALVDPDDGMEVRSGEDEEEVLARLRLNADGLRGEARRHHDRAMLGLERAAGRPRLAWFTQRNTPETTVLVI